MKNIFFLIVLATAFSCSKKTDIIEPLDGRITNYNQLEANFHNPPPEYRTAPFWVWNNDLSKEDIDRTLTEFKDKVIGGVFIHPRYGLITEYL